MLPGPHFHHRHEAGIRLGAALLPHATDRPLLVLGLPRGGVPVAARVAEVLQAPLDIFVVRKLGAPGHEELALGAIASGGVRILNDDLISQLRIRPEAVERITAHESRELDRREQTYRGDRPFPSLEGATIIVVDDGAATGASMRAAIAALRQLKPRAIIAAVPVASQDAVRLLRSIADECVCIVTPEPFHGVGAWYKDFAEVHDREVRALLYEARTRWESESAAGTPAHA
jgi:predicted phosphoribosyltransferase